MVLPFCSMQAIKEKYMEHYTENLLLGSRKWSDNGINPGHLLVKCINHIIHTFPLESNGNFLRTKVMLDIRRKILILLQSNSTGVFWIFYEENVTIE